MSSMLLLNLLEQVRYLIDNTDIHFVDRDPQLGCLGTASVDLGHECCDTIKILRICQGEMNSMLCKISCTCCTDSKKQLLATLW